MLLEITGPYWILVEDYWTLLNTTGSNRILLVPAGDYWRLLKTTGDCLGILEITGSYWILLKTTRSYWILRDLSGRLLDVTEHHRNQQEHDRNQQEHNRNTTTTTAHLACASQEIAMPINVQSNIQNFESHRTG